MKKIDGYYCRSVGNDATHLNYNSLPDKVLHLFACGDSCDIWERKDETIDDDGIVTDITYLYAIYNINERHNSWETVSWMTEDELVSYLEDVADEIAEQLASDHFWDLDSWGSDYPPENADEIIDRANEKITAYVKSRKWNPVRGDDIERFSESLWETYCSTGRI